MPVRHSAGKSTANARSKKPVMDPKQMFAHAGEAADFLKALANDQRLAILCTLLDGALSVGQINERVELSQSALSQHLAVLRDSNLVDTEKQSQTVYYSLHDDKTKRLLELLHDCFCK
ncbi:MAG TPA: metalloregulator ArsR/SmtB family transcription factor [Steroidobacteraceae bacterium]|nr:metalloregulator ArsR/SmtB family transcription factor [Steroidobacteraceae bacterium]